MTLSTPHATVMIAIIGAGASGTLTAIHVLRRARGPLSLRPVTQAVGQRMPSVERERFLRHLQPYWGHPPPPGG